MNEGIKPDSRKPVLQATSRFLYEDWVRLGQRLEAEELTDEERKILEQQRAAAFDAYDAASDQEKDSPEVLGSRYLVVLKYAIQQRDKSLLRKVILMIQEFVNRPSKEKDLDFIRFTEDELDKILKGDTATILVGSGTNGERIFISSKHLHMTGDLHGKEYRTRFARLFGLQFNPDQDLSVEF